MNANLKIDMRPLEDALRNRKLSAALNGQAVLAGLFTLEALAKLNIRDNFNQGTGDLASRWETKLDKSSDTNAEGHTSPLVIYARIQELGGTILPTSGQYLTFQTKDGAWHNVRAVTIPARPYLRPAADNGLNDIMLSVSNILGAHIESGK